MLILNLEYKISPQEKPISIEHLKNILNKYNLNKYIYIFIRPIGMTKENKDLCIVKTELKN